MRFSRKFLVLGLVAGIGVLGVGVAGAVTGGDSTPGPNPAANDHPNAHAWETIPAVVNTPTTNGPASSNIGDLSTSDVQSASTPAPGVAPSASALSTAMTNTAGTPGNTVLYDLVSTAPGPDRGATISADAQDHTPPSPSLPDQAQNGLTHKP